MEKRIELEKRARKANEIKELSLNKCRCTSIAGFTDEYTALEYLDFTDVGLTTLKGFPKLPILKTLELSNNKISDGLQYLTTSPKLQYLNLAGNKIKDFETLKPLAECKQLAILDLFDNDVFKIKNYREKIFQILPSLKYLDRFDINGEEGPLDEEDDDSNDKDKQNVFCLNGLEIDLDELEEFEKRVKAKKKTAITTANNVVVANDSNPANDETDDLDEYLKVLKLREEESTEATTTTTTTTATTQTLAICSATTTNSSSTPLSVDNTSINFAILLYWFLAILNLASAAYSSSSDVPEDLDEEDENDDDSLNEEDDGYVDSDIDDADADEDDAASEEEQVAANTVKKPGGADEPNARGKKRKHDC